MRIDGPYSRPGWAHWRSLWAEIVCNVFKCNFKIEHASPRDYWHCDRCRRSINAQ